jgi:hypothetical protein
MWQRREDDLRIRHVLEDRQLDISQVGKALPVWLARRAPARHLNEIDARMSREEARQFGANVAGGSYDGNARAC